MDLDITMRSNAASPRAKSWIIAAIALVLNWTVPAQLQFHPAVALHEPAPGVSPAKRASQPGNLPRLQARNVTCDASVPKAPQSRLNAGSKSHALLPQGPVLAGTGSSSALPQVEPDAPRVTATRVFDPRGPPALTV